MASLPEQLISRVFDELPSVVNTSIAQRSFDCFLSPPSVVAVPRGSLLSPVTDAGFGLYDTEAGQIRDRKILRRDFQIVWFFHGNSMEMAEELFLETVRILRRLYHNGVTFGAETWIDQQEGADDFVRDGHSISLVTDFNTPVFEAHKPLTTVEAFVNEVTIDGQPFTESPA